MRFAHAATIAKSVYIPSSSTDTSPQAAPPPYSPRLCTEDMGSEDMGSDLHSQVDNANDSQDDGLPHDTLPDVTQISDDAVGRVGIGKGLAFKGKGFADDCKADTSQDVTDLPDEDNEDESCSTDAFQEGQKVRIVRLSKAALNGTEGLLGKWNTSTGRWQVISNTRQLSVKPINLEGVNLERSELWSIYSQAAVRFDYNTEEYTRWVFDKIWYDANADGNVESLIHTVAHDENMFDCLYQAFVQP